MPRSVARHHLLTSNLRYPVWVHPSQRIQHDRCRRLQRCMSTKRQMFSMVMPDPGPQREAVDSRSPQGRHLLLLIELLAPGQACIQHNNARRRRRHRRRHQHIGLRTDNSNSRRRLPLTSTAPLLQTPTQAPALAVVHVHRLRLQQLKHMVLPLAATRIHRLAAPLLL